MKIIDEVSAKFSLSEAGHGQREVQFAYITKEGKTITPFCRCKDYFNDMFFTEKTGKAVSIYGFNWKQGNGKGVLDQDRLTIAVRLRNRNNTQEFYDIKDEEVKSVFLLLKQFNDSNKFNTLEVENSDDNKYVIISFDKKWIEIPYLCSAFHLFIRLGFTYKEGEDLISFYEKGSKNFISPSDESYFRSAKNKIKDLLEGKIDTKQKYEDYNTGNIHNYSGIVNYSKYSI